jgi:hypothetical protein
MRVIVQDEELNEEYIERIAMVPDQVDERARSQMLVVRGDSEHFISLAEQLRTTISSPEGVHAARNEEHGDLPGSAADEEDNRVLEAVAAFRARYGEDESEGSDEEEAEEEAEEDEEEEEEEEEEGDENNDADDSGLAALSEDEMDNSDDAETESSVEEGD